MSYKNKKTTGFTIVELLVVIVVIGILAAIVMVAYRGIVDRARISVIQTDLNNASRQLETSKYASENSSGQYPGDLVAAGLKRSAGTAYQYTYTPASNSYCLTATNSLLAYKTSSLDQIVSSGVCPGHTAPGDSALPSGYQIAALASGASTTFSGYSAVEPITCPSEGGLWIKVPGNTLYGQDNGFCVQQYPASNVSGVATSQATGARWTAINQPTAKSNAEATTAGGHLLSESEWMTIASNAAAQPQNWSGGAAGSGTLPTGSATSSYGGVSLVLSNGQIIRFDTGTGSYYASNEFTCYTGPSANNCALAAQNQPTPANVYFTDQLSSITNYGSFTTSAGYYYGDPRYANSVLAPYVNSSRDKGLGYLRSSYAAGSSTPFAFTRGSWTGAASSGVFTLYVFTTQTYAHATYGFRVAK